MTATSSTVVVALMVILTACSDSDAGGDAADASISGGVDALSDVGTAPGGLDMTEVDLGPADSGAADLGSNFRDGGDAGSEPDMSQDCDDMGAGCETRLPVSSRINVDLEQDPAQACDVVCDFRDLCCIDETTWDESESTGGGLASYGERSFAIPCERVPEAFIRENDMTTPLDALVCSCQ
jgi:hypothetical protein